MTTTTATPDAPEVSPPPGGEPDLWIEGKRNVYKTVGHLPIALDPLQCPLVTLRTEQLDDGLLGGSEVILDVAMGRSDVTLSSYSARALSTLLLQAAAEADRWSAWRPSTPITAVDTDRLLDDARDAVLRALAGIPKTDHHGAADCLQSAQFAIEAAQVMVR